MLDFSSKLKIIKGLIRKFITISSTIIEIMMMMKQCKCLHFKLKSLKLMNFSPQLVLNSIMKWPDSRSIKGAYRPQSKPKSKPELVQEVVSKTAEAGTSNQSSKSEFQFLTRSQQPQQHHSSNNQSSFLE